MNDEGVPHVGSLEDGQHGVYTVTGNGWSVEIQTSGDVQY